MPGKILLPSKAIQEKRHHNTCGFESKDGGTSTPGSTQTNQLTPTQWYHFPDEYNFQTWSGQSQQEESPSLTHGEEILTSTHWSHKLWYLELRHEFQHLRIDSEKSPFSPRASYYSKASYYTDHFTLAAQALRRVTGVLSPEHDTPKLGVMDMLYLFCLFTAW